MPKPRNRTALAYDARISNPPSAHPKDGVGNTAPGLEMDERGIEKYIFPGIVLEFQAQPPGSPNLPLVRSIDREKVPLQVGANNSRIFTFQLTKPGDYLFVYAFRTLGTGQVFRFYNFDDDFDRADTPRLLACWDAIRNAEYRPRDRIALMIGVGDLEKRADAWRDALAAFDDVGALAAAAVPPIGRSRGQMIWAVVSGERAPLSSKT